MFADDEDCDCPLCMEEFDLSDRGFRPCPCGYQICRFCWHHIKENLNGRCPACRSLYSEQTVQFVSISPEEIARIKKEKKLKERRQKAMELSNRKHLSNTRVVQKNLMYVLGLTAKYAKEESDLFRQFGKVSKIVISKRHGANAASTDEAHSTVGIYVTYNRKEDAAKAINGLDGTTKDGNELRASYGTTKYCTYYLSHSACPNPSCMYLHEPGEEADSYNKENLSIGKQQLSEVQNRTVSGSPLSASNVRKASGKDSPTAKAQIRKSLSTETTDKPALPAKARWATSWTTSESKSDDTTSTELTPEDFGPSLSDTLNLPQKPKHSPSLPKRKEKRIPRSSKAVRLDMIGSTLLEETLATPTTSKPEVVAKVEKVEKGDGEPQKVETQAIPPPPTAPVVQVPKVPKGWAVIPTVKPDTAKPPALAKLGQIPLPTRGEKRPARTDGGKRKEKRQHQQKGEEVESMPKTAPDAAPAESQMEVSTADDVPSSNMAEDVNDQANDLELSEVSLKNQDLHQQSDNAVQNDAIVVAVDQGESKDTIVEHSETAASVTPIERSTEKESDMVIDSVDMEVSHVHNDQDNEDVATSESTMVEERTAEAELVEDLEQNLDSTEENEGLNEEDDGFAEETTGADQSSESAGDEQSSFEFDDGEDILIEKLLSDETDDEFDLAQSYPAKTDELVRGGDNGDMSPSAAQGYNSNSNIVNQEGGMRQMKLPPGLGFPNMNGPMTPPPPPPPPFGFSPMHHQTLPPFMHRGFPPGLMPPPGMLPRGYDPFMGQDAEMMMARRLQHSQQMIAALGMMNTGDRPRGLPNLPPPRPIPMHGPPPGIPSHPSEHPAMFPSGSPSSGQLHGPHQMQSPVHSPFGIRGDSRSPLRASSIPQPPPAPQQQQQQQHIPYHQVTRAPDILPPRQASSTSPENNQLRSMQEGFRALLPNVNISFSPQSGSGNMQMNQHGGSDDISLPHGSFNDPPRIYPHGVNLPSASPSHLSHPGIADHSKVSLNSLSPMQSQQGWQKPSVPPGFSNQQQNVQDISNDMFRMRLSSPKAEQGMLPLMQQKIEPIERKELFPQADQEPKDIRTEAQNFFGNFLKQAAAHQQQSEKPDAGETRANTNVPFNDPAIMSARVATQAQTETNPSESMRSPLNQMQYRPSPPLNQIQALNSFAPPNVSTEGYPQRPLFSPHMGDRYMMQPQQQMMSQPPPGYMFHNPPQGPPGVPSPFTQAPPHGPPQRFPSMPPAPPGVSPEEHHHRMEQFMRANSGSM